MWLENNTDLEACSHLEVTGTEPPWVFCGLAFIHGIFAKSNHFAIFLHVKETLPSLLIFRLLSHPVSLSKLKDLEGNPLG